MSEIKISGSDVLLVRCISGELAYAKGTKMEGQTYRRYTYGGKAFISNDPVFYNELENGGVHTVTLDSNEEGQLSLTGFITFKKMVGLKKNTVILEAITVENYAPTSVKELEDLAV